MNYQHFIKFVSDMSNINVHISLQKIDNEIEYYSIYKLDGLWTEEEIRRMIKLKAFW